MKRAAQEFMKKINCKTCNNLHCFIKECLVPGWLSIIDMSKNQLKYKKGQYIFRNRESVAGIHFIQQGKVKVVANGFPNREQIVRLATDGHILGHRGYGADTYPISAVAMTDSVICFVDNATLYDACMKNPKFTYALMVFYSRELRKAELRMKYLGQMNVREKVAESLLHLKEIFGTNPLDNTLTIEISRQEIADLAGTNADQVTKQLRDFANEKIIVKVKRKLRLANLKKLEMIVKDFQVQEFFKQQ